MTWTNLVNKWSTLYLQFIWPFSSPFSYIRINDATFYGTFFLDSNAILSKPLGPLNIKEFNHDFFFCPIYLLCIHLFNDLCVWLMLTEWGNHKGNQTPKYKMLCQLYIAMASLWSPERWLKPLFLLWQQTNWTDNRRLTPVSWRS